MDKMDGGGIDDYNAVRSSSCPPTVGSNMAGNNIVGYVVAADNSPESYSHNNYAFESSIPGNFVLVDNPREHVARDYKAPHHYAPGDYILNDHGVGQDTPELYTGVGNVHDQGKPDTYMQVHGAGDDQTAGNSPLNPITIHEDGKLTLLLAPP